MSSSSQKLIVPGSGEVGRSTASFDGAANKSRVVLGYWSIRGLAQAIRTILFYTNTPFDDVRYQQGGADAGFSRAAWLDEKEKLSLDFPNLPYYYDDAQNLKITQSTAILRHLARVNNLYGESERIKTLCDLLVDEVYDYKSECVRVAYGGSPERIAQFEASDVGAWMTKFTAFKQTHGKDTKFMLADTPLLCDFVAAELFEQTMLLFPKAMESFPVITKYVADFKALPAIAAFAQHPNYIHRPINNMIAKLQ